MLESTNALIGALIATVREVHRCEMLVKSGAISESEEEELGDFINQLHEALADLSQEYESRRDDDSSLSSLDEMVNFYSGSIWFCGIKVDC